MARLLYLFILLRILWDISLASFHPQGFLEGMLSQIKREGNKVVMLVNRRYTARGKNLPSSPKKVRPIADNIRGKSYIKAIAVLCSMPNKGAKLLEKVVKSAASNAMYHNKNLSEDMIFVKIVMVDDGRRRKRFGLGLEVELIGLLIEIVIFLLKLMKKRY